MIIIPEDLPPADGHFGSGPAKVRPEALEYPPLHGDVSGASHCQAPAKQLITTVQEGLRKLYWLPEEYQVVLGNGGFIVSWDVTVCFLIERCFAYAVLEKLACKLAYAVAAAPFLADPAVTQCDPGAVILSVQEDADVVAWVQNETPTGVAAPVERVSGGLVLIDAASVTDGMAADTLCTDVYYFVPQKNFSSDGGLWVTSCLPTALERTEQIAAPDRWVPELLNLDIAASDSAKSQALSIPAITTLSLLEGRISWLLDLGGIDAAEGRYHRVSGHLYGWAKTPLYTTPFVTDPTYRSLAIATINLVPGMDTTRVIAGLHRNGIVDVDSYRALRRSRLRIEAYTSADQANMEVLTACTDHVVERL